MKITTLTQSTQAKQKKPIHKLLTPILAITLSATALTGITGCSSTTSAGALGVKRKQLIMVSNQQMLQRSAVSYNKMLQDARNKNKLDTNASQVARLQRIANQLIPQVSVYRPDAVNWNWEVHTTKSDSLNAFVAPGGKVMFYTGIIDRLELTDDEISAIMGHEMAHALRDHARERMSGAYATQLGIGILAGSLGLSKGETQLAGIVGDLGISRPHNRVQEKEADIIGLELMARAGYNPNSAVTLWKKMQKANRGGTPQFLSTHPSKANRIATLQSLMPKVLPLYQQATGSTVFSPTPSKYAKHSTNSSTNKRTSKKQSGKVRFPKYTGK